MDTSQLEPHTRKKETAVAGPRILSLNSAEVEMISRTLDGMATIGTLKDSRDASNPRSLLRGVTRTSVNCLCDDGSN